MKPEDRTFDLFDSSGRSMGQLRYEELKYKLMRAIPESKVATPWGEAFITNMGITGTKIVVGNKVLAITRDKLTNTHEITFPEKPVMAFKGHTSLKLMGIDYTYTGDSGNVTVSLRSGSDNVADTSQGLDLPAIEADSSTSQTRVKLGKLGTRDMFVKWVIGASGILPVDDDELMHGLALFFSCLQFCRS
jgi:hypothetical protein